MHWQSLVVLGTAGVAAAAVGRIVLSRSRRGVVLRPGTCELAGMVCFLIAGGCWSAGGLPGWWLPVPLAVAALAVPLCAVDLTRRRLPDVLTYPAYLVIPATLAVAAACGGETGIVAGGVLGALGFGGMHLVMHLVVPASLGAGDVKLAGSLGAVLGAIGLPALVLAGLAAALITLMLAAAMALVGRDTWHSGVPHGPGLLVATWLLALTPGAGLVS